MKNIERIGLGTVQFGLDYGVTNPDGKVSYTEVGAIVELARGAGIGLLDTAATYGDSEAVIGRQLECDDWFRIVTKTLPLNSGGAGEPPPQQTKERLPGAPNPVEAIRQRFEQSRALLRRSKVYALLSHRADDLLGEHGAQLWEMMLRLKSDSEVEKIGCSVYTSTEIEKLMSRYPLDIVQLPFNVFDQHMAVTGTLRALQAAHVEVHARSAFLQGILLSDPETLPSYLGGLKTPLLQYYDRCRVSGWTRIQAALGFVLGHPEIDRVIVGVCSRNHLAELLAAVGEQALSPDEFRPFACSDERLVNPSLWQKGK